ncbi:chorismate synthase [Clostridium sp. USBA 49]|uniref:chorismate synthase n=1 Tax=Clostridium sp. USBA 49 TaxID=1881060 RepID=UPI000999C10C|nr:chorismate synthase [Clostridium sp. USBA 49]SKA86280.1 chorismate synthase [Clostridium sp. USBA 49]
MSGVWGRKVKFSIFGESHGKGIGITIDGLPSGFKLDLSQIEFEMKRRAPGRNTFSTQRNEKDSFEIISGYFNEFTTGTPLCAVIWNNDQHSKDYDKLKNVFRPGHADYTGYVKYKGFNDYRGGGHFSGRLTAALVFAGAVAKQILEKDNIIIGSHLYQIGNIYDDPFDKVNISPEVLKELRNNDFPVLNIQKGEDMKNLIIEAKKDLDSVGGVIEAAAINLPAGLGSPFFDSVESTLAHLLFSIPAVKGVEFGEGFNISKLKGSKANDEPYIEEGKVKTRTNNNGGILGGITNGMPLIFRAAFKPTSSISKKQKTIDISKMENTELEVKGRHDPCIVQRAVPVVEAVTAMAVLDLLYCQ